MTITAEIIADSISPDGIRLTTMKLRYPRFIHAEFMTHRVFSRNASSSRAIPVERMIADIKADPAMPIYWGSNKPGMQAGEELLPEEIEVAKTLWLNSMSNAVYSAKKLIEVGLHKQIANRILEPWAHINVIVTATNWNNFFKLRRHKDAQPEIKLLADEMWDAMESSNPIRLSLGQWHLPFVEWEGQSDDRDAAEDYITQNGVLRVVPSEADILEIYKKVSTARCARVSYLTHDGRKSTVGEDLALYERLVRADIIHASPAEHQATPDKYAQGYIGGDGAGWHKPELHGNLTGWIQHRKTLPGEYERG